MTCFVLGSSFLPTWKTSFTWEYNIPKGIYIHALQVSVVGPSSFPSLYFPCNFIAIHGVSCHLCVDSQVCFQPRPLAQAPGAVLTTHLPPTSPPQTCSRRLTSAHLHSQARSWTFVHHGSPYLDPCSSTLCLDPFQAHPLLFIPTTSVQPVVPRWLCPYSADGPLCTLLSWPWGF